MYLFNDNNMFRFIWFVDSNAFMLFKITAMFFWHVSLKLVRILK